MKKIFAAAILAIVLISSAFANETYNFKGADHFTVAYPNAVGVSYKTTAEYTVVNYTVGEKAMQSIYNLEGELIATSYAITLDKLPTGALTQIQKKYAGYTIIDAIALDHDENGFGYYVRLEGQNKKVILTVSKKGYVSLFKKSKV